jgi:haloacetate dehalogenase
MTDLADLFDGFAQQFIDTPHGRFFIRRGGNGPPLLLLHGFPQTQVMWHKIAPILAQHFTIVAMDLRGYGQSFIPESRNGEAYTKTIMAQDGVAVMRACGFDHFHIGGHDRGGRVAYRMALDHPDKVIKCAVLDIVPTYEMWASMNAARAMSMYHWMFLAQPAPLPEILISAQPIHYLEHTLASWTAAKNLSCFEPRALTHYRSAFADAQHIHAMCEDYRAGATHDRRRDEDDIKAGQLITCPLLALWGHAGLPAQGESPLDVWRRWAPHAQGSAIEGGHFMAEENPSATTQALLAFFKS